VSCTVCISASNWAKGMNNYEYQVGGSLKMDALAICERHVDSELYHALVADEFCCVFSSPADGQVQLAVAHSASASQAGFSCAST